MNTGWEGLTDVFETRMSFSILFIAFTPWLGACSDILDTHVNSGGCKPEPNDARRGEFIARTRGGNRSSLCHPRCVRIHSHGVFISDFGRNICR